MKSCWQQKTEQTSSSEPIGLHNDFPSVTNSFNFLKHDMQVELRTVPEEYDMYQCQTPCVLGELVVS